MKLRDFIGKNKKTIGLMKGKLGGKVMEEVLTPRPEMNSYFTSDGCVNKKANGTEKYMIVQETQFQD